MENKQFVLFWLHGEKQIIHGIDIASAMNNSGIGNGALRALDFYADAKESEKWEYKNKKWQIKNS